MNKKFLKHYMETNPEGTAQTYIFLVDNQDIALNIVMSGYQAICLVQEDDGYYFSADSFIEEMRSIQFTGSCQSAYHYVAACTVKWMNDKLQTFFKDAGLDGKAGWQLFKEKEYLGKLDNQKEVEKLLEQYILRFERDPREEPELSCFHLFDAKGNVKGVRDMEMVDYLVENVQFFVVGITPYYYEHRKAERFVFHHPYIAFVMMFIGIPLFTLMAVAASTTVLILPIAWILGWL